MTSPTGTDEPARRSRREQLQPAGVRQPPLGQHQVGTPGLDRVERLLGGRRLDDPVAPVAGLPQVAAHQAPQHPALADDDDLHDWCIGGRPPRLDPRPRIRRHLT